MEDVSWFGLLFLLAIIFGIVWLVGMFFGAPLWAVVLVTLVIAFK